MTAPEGFGAPRPEGPADGMLYGEDGSVLLRCERPDTHVEVRGGCRAVGERAFTGLSGLRGVVLPDSVEEIAADAFSFTGLERFDAPFGLRRIGKGAFSGCPQLRFASVPLHLERFHELCFDDESGLEVLRILLPEPVCGRDYLDICFAKPLVTDMEMAFYFGPVIPSASTTMATLARCFRGPATDLARICEVYDGAIRYMRDVPLRARCMLDRLACPQHLSDEAHTAFRETLARDVAEACVGFAEQGFRQGFDMLADQGVVTADNIEALVERVAAAGDASATGHLLDMKARRFGGGWFDFEV